MKRVRRLAATLVLLIPGALSAQSRGALPAPDVRWLAVDTPAFSLLTDLDAGRAALLADRLERLHSLLAAITPEAVAGSTDTRVFVLADRRQYLRFAPRPDGRPDERVSGFFQTSIFGDRLVVDASTDPSTARSTAAGGAPLETLYHEALHAWVRGNLPWTPLWLNEGLAEYYSTARIEDEHAVLGLEKRRHLDWLESERWMSLADLVAVGSSSELYHEGDRRGSFYAESWGLVHYLLSTAERRELLGRYLLELARGADPNEAFEEVFDRSYLALEAELARYVAQPELPSLVVRSTLGGRPPAPRELARADALVRLGELATRLGHLGDAQALFAEALRLRPANGLAKAGLGEVKDLEGDHGTAEVWYREAVDAAPDAAITHYLLGEATLRRLLRQQRDDVTWSDLDVEDLVAARAHLRRSIALEPERAAAHAALGQSWLVSGDGPPAWGLGEEGAREAAGALARAAERLPGEPQILLHSGLLLCRAGDCERARSLAPSLERFRRPELLLRHEEQLATTELELAGWLVNHGDLDRGQAIAERLDATLPPGLRGQLGGAIDEIRRVARHNRAVATLDAAIELARQGGVREAIAVLDRLLDERHGAEIESTARELRRRLSAR
jgi:tetratricopeptide (TPR) repeat protein